MRTIRPQVTKRVNPGGSVSYCVDAGIVNGKRPRKFFADKKTAKAYAKKMLVAKKVQGELAFSLTSRQQIEAAKAIKDLVPANASLSEAVAYFLRHAQPKGGTITVNALNEEFIGSKTKTGKKPRYIKELRCKLNKFAKAFGQTLVSEIFRAKFEEWLDAQNFAPLTKVNYLRDIGMLFAFAVKRGHCAENIVGLVEKPAVLEKRVEIFKVGEAVHFLFAAHTSQPKLVPYVAIGLFAGLRSCELEQLDWEEINLHRRKIEVTADKAKTSQRRIVDISDNLYDWLKPHEKMDGPVVPKCWREKLQELAKFAELEKRPANVLRHSFGSYHVAKHQDASKTAFQMGHSTTKMLFQHYRELVQPEEAEKFWRIVPPRNGIMFFPNAENKKQSCAEATQRIVEQLSKLVGENAAQLA